MGCNDSPSSTANDKKLKVASPLSLSLSLFLSYFLNCCLSLSLLNHVCHFLSSFLYSRIVFSWILSVYLYVLKELLPRRQRQRDRKRERERERICLIRMKMNCRPEIKNFQITCGLLACCISLNLNLAAFQCGTVVLFYF